MEIIGKNEKIKKNPFKGIDQIIVVINKTLFYQMKSCLFKYIYFLVKMYFSNEKREKMI